MNAAHRDKSSVMMDVENGGLGMPNLPTPNRIQQPEPPQRVSRDASRRRCLAGHNVEPSLADINLVLAASSHNRHTPTV